MRGIGISGDVAHRRRRRWLEAKILKVQF